MHSTFTSAHPAAAKARKNTEKVRLTNLVPHDRTVASHLQKIDQATFMLFCISPDSGRGRNERVFSVYDFLKTRAACNPHIQRIIRSLGAVAIERGYLIYQRYLELRKRDGHATLRDAIESPAKPSFRRLISMFTSKARRLMNRLCEVSVRFRKACRTYGHERILDGFVSTTPPWIASTA